MAQRLEYIFFWCSLVQTTANSCKYQEKLTPLTSLQLPLSSKASNTLSLKYSMHSTIWSILNSLILLQKDWSLSNTLPTSKTQTPFVLCAYALWETRIVSPLAILLISEHTSFMELVLKKIWAFRWIVSESYQKMWQ